MNKPTPFSVWMRSNLKDAYSGLITQDIDFVISRKDNHYLIAEEKLYSTARTGPAQAVIYKMLSDILTDDSNFEGCHKITVNNNKTLYVNQTSTMTLDEFIKNPQKNYLNSYGQTWFDKILDLNMKYLWDGKGTPPTKKTESEHTYKRKSNLLTLLFENKIINDSIDWLFLNYCSGNFVLLSESGEFLEPTTLRILINLEKHNLEPKKAFNPKTKSEYQFLGAYTVKYNENLSKFVINGHELERKDAIRVLNLDDTEIMHYK